jgi:antitoxin PrlF
MDVGAKVTSKGQITVPKSVREALGLEAGDELVFRVHGDRAVVSKTPDFLDLAGSIAVPADKRGTPWDQVLREKHRSRARS